MKSLQIISVLMSAQILTACSSISPAGLIAASQLDPLNTPPGDVALALSMPDRVKLSDGDAMLHIAFAEGGHQLIDAEFPVQISPSTPGTVGKPQPGEIVYVGRLSAAEAKAFAAAQAEIRRLRAAGFDGTGVLAVNLKSACRVGPPLEALPVSTWLRTDPEAQFVQLTRQVDVLEELKANSVEIPAC